ncbi:MAG: hypothetical protein IKT58_03035 [Oscillospiraceae bacterium]|nr:hypothetical protein [Oscillospiraceae bacterium]
MKNKKQDKTEKFHDKKFKIKTFQKVPCEKGKKQITPLRLEKKIDIIE